MIIEKAGKSAAERSGTHTGANMSKYRGRNASDRQANPPLPARWTDAIPAEAVSETGQPPARKKKADCGELFRSWAFPSV